MRAIKSWLILILYLILSLVFFGRQLKFRCSSYFWIVLCGYLFLHDDVLQFWMTCLSFKNLRNLLFTGRVRLGANQNWSAHGTPRRMDGQLGCNFNGFPSSEKKKHNSGNKISVDQSWHSLSCFHKFPLIDLLRSVIFIQINFWIYWFLIKLQNDTIKRTRFRTFGIEIKRTLRTKPEHNETEVQIFPLNLDFDN